jgi:predicted aspartyl protease
MPIMHIRFAGKRQAADGTTVRVSPVATLRKRGPIVQVEVSVAQVIAEQLLQQGQVIPAPLSGAALIDTGASSTCIDEAAAQQLGLPIVDVVRIMSASHAATPRNVYPIQIKIEGFPVNIKAPRAVGVPLATQNLLMLIGRDVLQHCNLFYNGPSGEITVAI